MSPHGDLIGFGFFALAVAVPVVWYYLWSRFCHQRTEERHWASVERHNYRVWTALKELDHCDGSGGRS